MDFSSYSIGYRSREMGISKEKNPFPAVGEHHKNWNKGWDHADQENTEKQLKAQRMFPLKLVREKPVQ